MDYDDNETYRNKNILSVIFNVKILVTTTQFNAKDDTCGIKRGLKGGK